MAGMAATRVSEAGLAQPPAAAATGAPTAVGKTTVMRMIAQIHNGTRKQMIAGGATLLALIALVVGVVLYEMVTGRAPFEAKTTGHLYELIAKADYVRPSALNAALPRPVEALIARCLHKKPSHRYASAGDLLPAIERSVAAVSSPPPERAAEAPAARENRPIWTARAKRAMMAVAAVLMFSLVFHFLSSPSPAPPDPPPPKTPVASQTEKDRAWRPVRIDAVEERVAVYQMERGWVGRRTYSPRRSANESSSCSSARDTATG